MKRNHTQTLALIPLLLLVSCTGVPRLPVSEETPRIATGQPPLSSPTNDFTPNAAVQPTTAVPTPLPSQDISGLPMIESLSAGWHQIDPGGNTSCARGGKYSFFVRKANSNKLLVYFEGGGNCYDAKTCRIGANTFDESIDPTVVADNPAMKADGLFALGDTRNPFKDYNIVFINYCTGDAFLGNRTVQYQDGENTFQVNHIGFVNTQTVFEWIYRSMPKPDSVFMVGCSAGVVGSYFNLPYFMQHYPDTPVALIGDSGGGYLNGPVSFTKNFGTLELLPKWLPQYQDIISGDLFRTEFIFIIPAQTYPSVRFGLIDTQEDGAQAEIISRFNRNLTLKDVLQSNLAKLHANTKNIYSYSGPGDHHCITMQPAYYDYAVGGVKLNDWVSGFSTAQPPQNIEP